MELYQQILASRIGSVPIDTQTAKEIVAGDSYKALEKIRAILADGCIVRCGMLSEDRGHRLRFGGVGR